jgi:cytoskeletal protein CcmA (bactofilin family)
MGLFSRTPPPPPSRTLIGPKTAMRGHLSTRVLTEVQGALEGSVACKGVLLVQPGGKLKGEVVSETFLCRGEASGKANVSGLASLGEGATWDGELRAGRLQIERGAKVSGTIHPPAVS